jgi:4-amino-4-deoxy-L-arabinose transferase-like glycosyltransferase
MTTARAGSSRTVQELAALIVVALAVRLAWLQRGVIVTADGSLYLKAARNLVLHHVFSHGQSALDIVPTVNHPPLYPALIALLWWTESAPRLATGLLQVAFSAATVGLVYLIARERFNRTVALLASAGMTLAPMSSFYTTLILTETVFTFLVTLGVFLWGRERAALCGVAFGLAALTRTTMLPFVVLLLLLPLLPAWRRAWRTYLLIALTALTVSSVWIVRDAFVSGRFVPVATGGGLNLLFGTIETSIFGTLYWTGSAWTTQQREIPVFQADEALPEVERDRARARRALGRILADPLRWLIIRAKQYPKLFIDTGAYVLDPAGDAHNSTPATPRSLVLSIKAVFILGNLAVMCLAAFAIFSERARFASLTHIMLFPLYLSVIHLALWIEPRYSLPMMPLVAILAALGALRLAGKPVYEEQGENASSTATGERKKSTGRDRDCQDERQKRDER